MATWHLSPALTPGPSPSFARSLDYNQARAFSLSLPSSWTSLEKNPQSWRQSAHDIHVPKAQKSTRHQPWFLELPRKVVIRVTRVILSVSEKGHQGTDGRNPRPQKTLWCLAQNHLPLTDHSQSIFPRIQEKSYVIHAHFSYQWTGTALIGPRPQKAFLKISSPWGSLFSFFLIFPPLEH